MKNKQVIKINENQLKHIVIESVKRIVNEQFGADFEDTLRWVQKKFPNKSPQEQERFARNIIKKKGKTSIDKSSSNTDNDGGSTIVPKQEYTVPKREYSYLSDVLDYVFHKYN